MIEKHCALLHDGAGTSSQPECFPSLQVLPCSKRFCHDWTVCPYAHPGEKAKRRDPRVHSYTGIACPNMKKVATNCLLPVSTD